MLKTTNKILCGDSCQTLKRLQSDSVDLIYIDPPFFANRVFEVEKKSGKIISFDDTWSKNIGNYLNYMKKIFTESKRVLKNTGSIYVHCDWHASHYLKITMDEIFGYKNFQNEIVWRRHNSHNDTKQGSKHLRRVHDTILFYSKSKDCTWNPIYKPYPDDYVKKYYRHIETKTGRRYAHGDLSTVYPIARGTGPALVPILGVFILGEAISSQAMIGIVTVVVGIFVVYWSGNLTKIFKNPLMILGEKSTLYALATGMFICLYSVWDKKGVVHVTPFLYMYLMALGSGIFITPYILKARSLGAIVDEWRLNYRAIVLVSALTFLAYGLVLTALSLSKLSYVWPAREMGIVAAVLLGTLVLKEPFGRSRLLGSLLVVFGVVLVALAP